MSPLYVTETDIIESIQIITEIKTNQFQNFHCQSKKHADN